MLVRAPASTVTAFDYKLTSDGTTVTAYDKSGIALTSAPSLHTLLAALSANTRLYLTAGTYPTTAEAVPKAGMILFGVGLTAVIQKQANGNLMRLNAAGVTLRDLVCDGNQAAGFTGSCLANSVGGDDVTIANCTVKNANTVGISNANCSRLTVDECRFAGNQQQDIFLNPTSGVSRDCKVVNSILDGTGTTGKSRIQASPGAGGTADCNGLQVIGNTIIPGNWFGVELNLGTGVATQDWVVSANRVVLSANALGGFSFSGVGPGLCSANTFDVNGFNATTAGIEIAGGTGANVSGNVIVGGTTLTCGIILDGSVTSSGHIVASNTINGLLATATGAIRVIANTATSVISDVVIASNNITWGGAGTGISGIHVQTNNAAAHADRVVISGNVVRGNNAATSAGIKLVNSAGSLDRTVIIGNCNTNVVTAISQSLDTNTLLPAGTNQA